MWLYFLVFYSFEIEQACELKLICHVRNNSDTPLCVNYIAAQKGSQKMWFGGMKDGNGGRYVNH